MFLTDEKIRQIPYTYLPKDFDVSSWEEVQAFLEELAKCDVSTTQNLETMLLKYSDLLKCMSDELSWRYIKMTVNADDSTKEKEFNDYFANIYAPAEAYQFKIKKRFYESPVRTELDSKKYSLLNQIFSNDIKLFREENIPLMIQESELANKYAGIVSKMSAIFEGEEKTPAQLSVYLKDPDRNKRENAWRLRMNMFAEKQEELNKLYSDLIALRHQIAVNADFSNYRDFKHQEMGRFSYTPEELFAFHKSVEKVVMPFIAEQNKKRKDNLIKEIDSWLGVPYKYGGKDKSGTDCSGMVFSIYNNVYGFSLNRSSYDIIQNVIKVPIEEAKFGDLVFFKIYKNRVSHVGIYLGDKKFIHASTQLGVRIDSLEMPYYRDRFYMAGRIKDELLKKDTADKSKDQ